MMNALRLSDGFPSSLYSERTGLPISSIDVPLQAAEQQGFLEWDVKSIRPTEKGKLFLNDLLELFLTDED